MCTVITYHAYLICVRTHEEDSIAIAVKKLTRNDMNSKLL